LKKIPRILEISGIFLEILEISGKFWKFREFTSEILGNSGKFSEVFHVVCLPDAKQRGRRRGKRVERHQPE
jgi:hypothetical protein